MSRAGVGGLTGWHGAARVRSKEKIERWPCGGPLAFTFIWNRSVLLQGITSAFLYFQPPTTSLFVCPTTYIIIVWCFVFRAEIKGPRAFINHFLAPPTTRSSYPSASLTCTDPLPFRSEDSTLSAGGGTPPLPRRGGPVVFLMSMQRVSCYEEG